MMWSMPTSTFRLRSASLVMACMAPLVLAHATSCRYAELAPAPAPASSGAVSGAGLPWSARIDAQAGAVDVLEIDGRARCRVELEDVRQVYGRVDTIVLRVTEVSSDQLYFFDPRTCARRARPVRLGISTSGEAERRALARAGVCAPAASAVQSRH